MAGINIGPIHIGDSSDTPDLTPDQLQAILAGKTTTKNIQTVRGADGTIYQVTPDPNGGVPTLTPMTGPNGEPVGTKPPAKGESPEDLAALAQAAVAKANAGQQPSQAELTAYFKLQAQQAGANGKSQYAPPIAGYTGPIEPHHAGEPNGATDLFAPPGTPVQAPISGTIVRAGPYGAAGNDIYLKGDDGHYYDFEHIDGLQVQPGDTVTTGQPLAVVATLDKAGSSAGPTPHLHFAVANADGGINYDDHGTGSDGFDTTGFLKSIYSGQGGLPPLNLGAKAQQPTLHAMGDKLYRYDPATGQANVIVDASGEKAPTTHQIGNTLYQYDPASKTWQQAIQGPPTAADMEAKQKMQGAFVTAMQQRQQTVDYIKQQVASGAMTPQQAIQYDQQSQTYFQAALKGTTPWQMQQEQMQQDTQRAQVAKGLLDSQLQQQATMADTMLGHALTGVEGSKYGTMAPGTLSGLYEGVMNDVADRNKPMSDLAQSLLQAIAPRAAAAGLDPRVGPLTGLGGPAAPSPADQPAPALPPDVMAQLGIQPTLAAAGSGGL